jgi:hypothetical protein
MQANPNNFRYFYAISVLVGSTIFITTASWLVGDARPSAACWSC